MHQIHISETFDVEAVERELGILWKDSAAEEKDESTAVMRARVANLVIFTTNESRLDEITATLEDLSAVHPSRALVVVADSFGSDRDIELFISSFYRGDQDRKRLCCEEVLLIARGKFVPELSSVALPLLVPDLPTFLWWREQVQLDERSFQDFSKGVDRLVIDSSEATNSRATLLALASLFSSNEDGLGISDINWARLTSWRALLASFYDANRSRAALQSINQVVIDYSAPEDDKLAVSPQALLIIGWLASRLNWDLETDLLQKDETSVEFNAVWEGRQIRIQFRRVVRSEMRPGRLARVELLTEDDDTDFVVLRHENGRYLETQARFDGAIQPGRVLPVRNRSTAQLLGRELEFLCNDNIYAEAVRMAARIVERLG